MHVRPSESDQLAVSWQCGSKARVLLVSKAVTNQSTQPNTCLPKKNCGHGYNNVTANSKNLSYQQSHHRVSNADSLDHGKAMRAGILDVDTALGSRKCRACTAGGWSISCTLYCGTAVRCGMLRVHTAVLCGTPRVHTALGSGSCDIYTARGC